MIESRADEALINAHKNLLKDDARIIVMGKLQPDRFSGGMQLTVNQIWDLEQARCRFGKFLRVAVNGHAPDVAHILKAFPAQREDTEQGELVRGLGIRLSLTRSSDAGSASAELQLSDAMRFFPTDAALAQWRAQADQGQAVIVYD